LTWPKAPVDERGLWDLFASALVPRAVLVAHRLGIFRLLAEQTLSLGELCNALRISPRPAAALLVTCVAGGLLDSRAGRYSLTTLSSTYLVEGRPHYFGEMLTLLDANERGASFERLMRAVLDDRPQMSHGQNLFESHDTDVASARTFTHGMHRHSIAPACVWPEILDLSAYTMLLDIGGGAGTHAISAAQRWPNLRAVVLDKPSVCDVARNYIADAQLQDRVATHNGDLWRDPFPAADVHLYADILHDWSPEKGSGLVKKSFDALPVGGRIIIHEMVYSDDKAGPLAVAGYGLAMLLWTEGQQYSAAELAAMLVRVGFVDVRTQSTFGYWSIATGVHP
jgi:cyclopropane fatty-acyl-phospholipid synthase-like methyltransferase